MDFDKARGKVSEGRMDPDEIFNQPKTSAGSDRSRLVMAISGAAVVVVIALIIFVASRPPREKADEGWLKAGTPEFNGYASSIKFSNLDKSTASTLVGSRLGYLRATVQNTGNKTIVGLRIRGVALGFSNETLAQRVATPIPRQRDALGPNESMEVRVQIDPIPDPNTIMDMVLQLYEFKLK